MDHSGLSVFVYSVFREAGGRLNINMSFYQSMDPYVKDKTVSHRNRLILNMGIPFIGKAVFILTRALVSSPPPSYIKRKPPCIGGVELVSLSCNRVFISAESVGRG